MKDIERRIQRWRVKYTPDKQRATVADIYDDMTRRYEAAVTALCAAEDKTRQVLNMLGVHTSFYVPYLDFARQLYKLTRQRGITGDSFSVEAKVLLDKWTARNADPAVLTAILTEVFSAPSPTP